jgi:hypothetical protein
MESGIVTFKAGRPRRRATGLVCGNIGVVEQREAVELTIASFSQ